MTDSDSLLVHCLCGEGEAFPVLLGEPPARGLRCSACGREHGRLDGILDFLPAEILQKEVKDSEQKGWEAVACDHSLEHYLSLPFVQGQRENTEYWDGAAREFAMVLELLHPLEGKRGLDLGGSIGWAAHQFQRRGARMVLADYNDSSRSGLGRAALYHEHCGWFPRFRVDAERLPFAQAQFDFAFSSSFLHHLTDPGKAVAGVARSLRPGGMYFAICEAFQPLWLGRQQVLEENDEVQRFLAVGINEQVFPQADYLCWFEDAGLKVNIINPRWDIAEKGRLQGGRLLAGDYRPEMLEKRRHGSGAAALAAKALLGTDAWRLAVPLLRSEAARRAFLALTRKPRILCGRKAT